MLVIFIVGIVAALAMPNLVVEDEGQALHKVAEELRALLELQEEEAILTGTQRGLRLYQYDDDGDLRTRFRWLVWVSDEGAWRAIPNQRRLQGEFPGRADITLTIEGRPVDIEIEDPREQMDEAKEELDEEAESDSERDKKEQPPSPQVIVFSSGEISEFELIMASVNGDTTLSLSGGYEGLVLDDGSTVATED